MRWPTVATFVLVLMGMTDQGFAQSRPPSPRIINFQTTAREDAFVAVVGEVAQPGVYRLPASTEPQTSVATIEQLVTQAGGLSPAASPSLRVVRKSRPDQRVYYHPAGATALEAGDVIVAESPPTYAPPDASKAEQNGVQLVLLGVLPRPIVVRVKPHQASISQICAMLGHPPELSRHVKVLSSTRVEHVDQTISQTSLLIFAPNSINPALLPDFPPVRELTSNPAISTSKAVLPVHDSQVTPTGMLRNSPLNQTTEDANAALLQQAEIGVGRSEPLGEPYIPGSSPRQSATNHSAPWPRQASNPGIPSSRVLASQVEDVPPPPGTDHSSMITDRQTSTPLPGGTNAGSRYSSSGMTLPILPAISPNASGNTEAAMASQSESSARSGSMTATSAVNSTPLPQAPYTGPTRVELPAYAQKDMPQSHTTQSGALVPDAPLPPEVNDNDNQNTASQGIASYLTSMAMILGAVMGLMGAAFAAGRFLDPILGNSTPQDAFAKEHDLTNSPSLARHRSVMPTPANSMASPEATGAHVTNAKSLEDFSQPYRDILKPAMERAAMTPALADLEKPTAERPTVDQPAAPVHESTSTQRMIEDLLHNRLELHEEPAWINRQLRFQELPADRRFARIDPVEAPLSQESGQMPHFLLNQTSRTTREPVLGDRPIHRDLHEDSPRSGHAGSQQGRASASSAPVFRRVDSAQDIISRDRTAPPASAASKGAAAPFEQALVQLRGTKKS